MLFHGGKKKEKEVCLEPDTLSWALIPGLSSQLVKSHQQVVSVTATICWDAREFKVRAGAFRVSRSGSKIKRDNRVQLWGFSCRSK